MMDLKFEYVFDNNISCLFYLVKLNAVKDR